MISRRDFLLSACGAATTLFVCRNASGMDGDFVDLPRETVVDVPSPQWASPPSAARMAMCSGTGAPWGTRR